MIQNKHRDYDIIFQGSENLPNSNNEFFFSNELDVERIHHRTELFLILC